MKWIQLNWGYDEELCIFTNIFSLVVVLNNFCNVHSLTSVQSARFEFPAVDKDTRRSHVRVVSKGVLSSVWSESSTWSSTCWLEVVYEEVRWNVSGALAKLRIDWDLGHCFTSSVGPGHVDRSCWYWVDALLGRTVVAAVSPKVFAVWHVHNLELRAHRLVDEFLCESGLLSRSWREVVKCVEWVESIGDSKSATLDVGGSWWRESVGL